jgi:hypothetical protein
LTADQVREHVETDLKDPALLRLIADADAEIVRRFGPHTANVNVLVDVGLTLPPGDFPPYTYPLTGWIGPQGWTDTRVFLPRPASAIVSVSETFSGTTTVLDATDYELLMGGLMVQRVGGGTHSSYAWRGRVQIVFTPVDDSARRTRVELDLVQLALSYNALQVETIGDYSARRVDDYQQERQNILAVLEPTFSIA